MSILTRARSDMREILARFDRKKDRALRVSPAFYELEHEPLRLRTADGVELAAWFVPAPAESRQAGTMALLHHHYGGQKAALLPWIELLHRQGLACLAFDARAHAGSPCPPELDSYRQRFHDVQAAHAELLRRGARRVVAYAQSQGAAVVAGGLAREPELAAVIFDSGPAAFGVPSIGFLAHNLVPAEQRQRRLVAAMLTVELVRRTGPGRYAAHLWPALVRLRDRPLLWLHGSADTVIPRGWAEPWFRALRPGATAWQALRLEGAAHAQCLQHAPAEVERAVARFVESLSGPRPGSRS
jgi:alpha-beta hydrolase superfamily lysophospholipase